MHGECKFQRDPCWYIFDSEKSNKALFDATNADNFAAKLLALMEWFIKQATTTQKIG